MKIPIILELRKWYKIVDQIDLNKDFESLQFY